MSKILTSAAILLAVIFFIFSGNAAKAQTKKNTEKPKMTITEWFKKELKLCYSKKGKNCFNIAFAAEVGRITGTPDFKTAEQFYKKSCDLNYYRSCLNLANNYASKKFKSAPKEGKNSGFKKAFKLYKKSCVGNIPTACTYYGSLNVRFANGQKEAAWAYGRACILRSAKSCLEAGKIFSAGMGKIDRQGGGVKKDTARASTYFAAACIGGIKKACR